MAAFHVFKQGFSVERGVNSFEMTFFNAQIKIGCNLGFESATLGLTSGSHYGHNKITITLFQRTKVSIGPNRKHFG